MANEVYNDSGAAARIEKEGYTRVDPFWISAQAGVTVMLRPLDKLLGAFLRQDAPGILVNSERSAGLIHMTCAHELGHFFMGHDTTADEKIDYGAKANRMEQEADWFAYQLLTPRVLLANVLKRKGWSIQSLRDPQVLYQLSLRLGISYTAAAWSLYRQKLFDRPTVDSMLEIQPADIKRELVGDRFLDPRKEVWLLDDKDRSSILEPRPEDQLLLRLSNHASSGYAWSANDMAAQGFQLRPVLEQPKRPNNLSQLVFGGPTTADYLLTHAPTKELARAVPMVLAMEERRPWSLDTPASATFETKAQFEQVNPGLTPAAKERLLQEGANAP
jgi:Zn-dependent peptidase ImmA (M78 family)